MTEPDEATPVEVGDILAEKYRVERVLGEGGMGVVVAATHVELEELRALKFMLPKVSADAEAVQRFLREARAAARLKSEHVATIYDIGRLEGGEPYLVMEYLEGDDLSTVLERAGQLPVKDAVNYTLQVLAGLAEAHAVGIVHRDLKPANIFVAKGTDGLPRVKIVDFGISKLTGAAAEQSNKDVTQTSALLGSPHYMSPEQLACARNVDHRTDVWSVGAMLYEMLCGKVPFDGPSVTAITIAAVQKEPDLPSSTRDDVPDGLDDVVLRCLAKAPRDRHAHVAALAEALAPFSSKRSRPLIDHIRRVHRSSRVDPAELDDSESIDDGPESYLPRAAPAQTADRSKTAATWSQSDMELPEPLLQRLGRKRVAIAIAAAAAVLVFVLALAGSSPDETAEPAAEGASDETTTAVTTSEATDTTSATSAEPGPEPSVSSTAAPTDTAEADAAAPQKKRRRGRRRRVEDIYDKVDKDDRSIADDPYEE